MGKLSIFCALRPNGLKRQDGKVSAYEKQPFFSFLLETRSLWSLAGLPGRVKITAPIGALIFTPSWKPI